METIQRQKFFRNTHLMGEFCDDLKKKSNVIRIKKAGFYGSRVKRFGWFYHVVWTEKKNPILHHRSFAFHPFFALYKTDGYYYHWRTIVIIDIRESNKTCHIRFLIHNRIHDANLEYKSIGGLKRMISQYVGQVIQMEDLKNGRG